ncbi:unnamed protein product [Schistocephalus solidus]|uniref:Uncharacterized protein n=1 Tax=Schistocephalus solidus TaxID=70667 RepID=A0A183T0T7_SCHSO|nr:unnamed protein product [Schistocephalus solidus]
MFRKLCRESLFTTDTMDELSNGVLAKILKLVLDSKVLHNNELVERPANLPVVDEDASVENRWCQLRDTVQSTALVPLDRTGRQHQDWFDENDAAVHTLQVKKNRLHKDYVDCPTDAKKAAFYRSCHLVQQQLREMRDTRLTRKAEEIKGYVDRNAWRNFFAVTKVVFRSPVKGTAPHLYADGTTLLTTKTRE